MIVLIDLLQPTWLSLIEPKQNEHLSHHGFNLLYQGIKTKKELILI